MIDLGTTPEQEQLRREVALAFEHPELRRELDLLRASAHTGEPDPRGVYRQLGKRRLLAPDWPVELGGRGGSPLDTALVVEEMVGRGVPETLHTLSIQIVGQFLLAAGDPAQRALLPGLAAGLRFATVLYSEAEAGSDLAALQTRAERRSEGGYVLSGRKLYCVKSGLADFGLCAARTAVGGSRYAGLSLFLVPLDAPGVRVEPVAGIADERFCAVDLDGVGLEAGALVGREGDGWALTTRALAFERTGVEHHARCRRWLALRMDRAGPESSLDELEEIGRCGAEAEAARLLSWRTLRGIERGRVDEAAAAMAKWYGSEAARRSAWLLAESEGMCASLDRDDPEAPSGGVIEAAYREAPGLTISAGTSEMMLQLIASAGLTGTGHDRDELDPVQRQLRRAVRAIVAGVPSPGARWSALAELEVFALGAPLEAGGLDLGQCTLTLVCEELGRGLAGRLVLDTLSAVDAAAAAGRPLDGLCSGGVRVAAATLDGTAEPGPGGWTLSGRARFVAAPHHADVLLVDAGTERFWVTTDRRGWSYERRSTIAPGGHCTVGFDGLHVDTGEVLGSCPPRVLGRTRLRRAAFLTGLAGAALDEAVAYAQTRRQFDRALVENQAIGFRLAELRTLLEAARLLARYAAWLDDAGRPALGAATEALAAASELALQVTREGMQVHGAYGSTGAASIQRFYRSALSQALSAGRPADLWREAGRLRAT